MPIKTSYTEDEVQQYMEDLLGDTADKLGLSNAGGDFDEPTLEVLYRLDEADFSFVSTAAEAYKVRIVATYEAWRAATSNTAHEASFSAGQPGTGNTSRDSIFRHCRDMMNDAYDRMVAKYPALADEDYEGYGVESTKVTYEGDIYRINSDEDDEWALDPRV